jgi:hypothetical protein
MFEEFNKELQEDTKIDQINLLDKQMMLPAIRHKWVARLIEYKRKLNSLNRKKKTLKDSVLDSLREKGIPTGIPKASLDNKINSSDVVLKIQEDIEEVEIIIEYLEKVELIFRSMTYDYSNIVKLISLETT